MVQDAYGRNGGEDHDEKYIYAAGLLGRIGRSIDMRGFWHYILGVMVLTFLLQGCPAYGYGLRLIVECQPPQQYDIDGVPLEAMKDFTQEDHAREALAALVCKDKFGPFSCLKKVQKIPTGYRYNCERGQYAIED